MFVMLYYVNKKKKKSCQDFCQWSFHLDMTYDRVLSDVRGSVAYIMTTLLTIGSTIIHVHVFR
jgi:hypothetical protein